MENKTNYTTWSDMEKIWFKPDEIAAMDLMAELYGEVMGLNVGPHKTQKDVESTTGVKQPVISRVMNGDDDPKLSTLIRLISPNGKTFRITPLEEHNE